MSELLPCPFCGGEADIEEIPGSPFTNEPYTWAVGCKSCNIGWYEETQAEATSKWNRRAQPENEPLTLEELIQRCTPKAAELLKRGLFGAVKVCAVDETIQKTNADRIRCISDEELAKIIVSESVSEKIPFCQNKPECSKMLDDDELNPESHCIKCALDWLQQPYKEWGKCDRFFIDDGGQCSAPSCWDTDKRDYRIGVKCGGDKAKCCLSDQYT